MNNLPPNYDNNADDKQINSQEPDIEEEDQPIPDEHKELFRQYANLIAERDEVEEALKTIGVQLKGSLEQQGIKKAYLPGWGSFSVIMIPRWTYSDDIMEKEMKLKAMKEIERKKGIAQSQATSSLRYTKEK